MKHRLVNEKGVFIRDDTLTKKIVDLRRTGKKYIEIQKETGASFSSITYHLKKDTEFDCLIKARMERQEKRHEKQRRVEEKYSSLTVQERSYMAGIVDGEGTITICKNGSGIFAARLQVANTSTDLMNWIMMRFGGTIDLCSSTYKPRCKTCHRWTLSEQRAIFEVLKYITQYLVIKDRQAEIVMSFCVSRIAKSKEWNPKYSREDVLAYEQVHALNHPGVQSVD